MPRPPGDHRQPRRRQLALVLPAAVAGVALARLVVEQREEASGRRPPTWSTTRVIGPEPTGALAGAMAAIRRPTVTASRRRLAAMAWAAPTTLAGLVGALLAGGRWTWDDELGAIVVRGGRGPLARLGHFKANAIGNVIVSVVDEPSRRLLVHEATHVRQAEVLGPMTLPLYVWWMARYGYRNHPMERGARASARWWLSAT